MPPKACKDCKQVGCKEHKEEGDAEKSATKDTKGLATSMPCVKQNTTKDAKGPAT